MKSVTAVIPVHNHAGWCMDAVRSVAEQDHRPLRIVVVDDGSTDGSAEVVLGALSNVRCPEVQGEPKVWMGMLAEHGVSVMVQSFAQARGPAFARNWGVRVSRDGTDYFAFLDSDDYYHPGKISLSVRKFLDDERVAVVYSDYDTLRPDGLRLRQYKEPFSRRRLLQECLVNCDSLISAAAIDAVGGMDESLRVCEDYDWWLRISERFLAVHVPESLLTIRVGSHSSSSTVRSETWKACYGRVFEKLKERQRAG